MNSLVKYTIGFGVYSIVMALLMRFVIPIEFVYGGKFIFLQLVLMIAVMVILGRIFFRRQDYKITYGEALKDLFLGTTIATVVSMILTVTLYTNADAYKEKFKQVQIENTVATMAWGYGITGKSEEEIELMKEDVREKIASGEIESQEFPVTWAGLPFMLLVSIISVLIYSLIAAIFVKQKQTAP